MLEHFRFVMRQRVTFGEVDMMQHVNNTVYLRWAESGRVEYLQEVLAQRIGGESGIILARIVNDYDAPLHFREHVAIGTRVARIGGKSMDFAYEIWSEDRALRAAHGVATVVGFDYVADRSMTIPQAWREKIAAYEGAVAADGIGRA